MLQSTEDNLGSELIHKFLAETDLILAFYALDNLTNWIIENSLAATTLKNNLSNSFITALRSRVLEVDAAAEKHHALQALNRDKASLQETYPWYHDSYHKAEANFILKNVAPQELNTIAHVGHGAIPPLSYHLFEARKDCQFYFYDIDPKMTELAKLTTEQCCPNMNVTFSTADFLTDHCFSKNFSLLIISNAVVSAFQNRDTDLQSSYVFVRASSPSGSLVYPELSISPNCLKGYSLKDRMIDSHYGIHEFLLFSKN